MYIDWDKSNEKTLSQSANQEFQSAKTDEMLSSKCRSLKERSSQLPLLYKKRIFATDKWQAEWLLGNRGRIIQCAVCYILVTITINIRNGFDIYVRCFYSADARTRM